MDDLTQALIASIVFAAVFTQSLVGFGCGLIAMPLLSHIAGIRTAAPLVALINLTVVGALAIRYRNHFSFRAVAPLWVSAVFGIPTGVLLVRHVEEAFTLGLLGVFIAAYALYGLFTPRLPYLKSRAWAYGFGFLSGICGGAYNSSGPPAIVYGNCRRWQPAEFKGNLQGFFLFNTVLTNLSHALNHNTTPAVLHSYALSLPAIAAGVAGGLGLYGRLKPDRFRKAVLVLLAILGVQMVASALWAA